MKKIYSNLNYSKIDSISKFNLYNKNLITNIESLIFFSKININDTNFMRDFFFLSKLFYSWFDKKISILHIIKDKKKSFNRGKRSLTFFFGCTLRKNLLIKNVDYLNNVLFFLTKKIDGSLNFRVCNSGFVYHFNNTNFVLGFKSERFFNLNIKINIFYNFSKNNNLLNNKIIKFYEKVFF